MANFHGDDIDRMLEGQSSAFFGGETQQPPTQPQQPPRDRDRERRRRSRSKDRDRSGTRRRERDRLRMTPDEMATIRTERLDRERERDQRTVFAAQIHPKNEEREIFDFFSEVGKVVDIQLIRDTRTYKSKGLAYIEFEDRRSVPHALALSGRNLNGYPVLVQMTQSDRGYAPTNNNNVTLPQEKPKTLHVRNLHKKLTEDDVIPIFNAFGEVRSVDIVHGPEANEAFVEFRRGAEATTAMVQLNGLEVVGRQISVEQAGDDAKQRAGCTLPSGEVRTARFEDESGNGGVVMSVQDKQSLMNNLAKRAGLAVPESNPYTHMKTETANDPPQQSRITRCILLTNMFDPTTETDPDFDLEIREDVREEVTNHGTLRHIYVDKNSRDGRVYMKFEQAEAAELASKGLDGRWFAQNRICSSYLEEDAYAAQFPGV